MSESTARCIERRDKIVEWALSQEETSPNDGNEMGGEEFAIVGLVSV
jgi:hypothetical protein